MKRERASFSLVTARSCSWIVRVGKLEKYEVPTGAALMVEENQEVKEGTVSLSMGPTQYPNFWPRSPEKIRYEDVVEGETVRMEKDPGGNIRRIIIDHRGDLHPQIVLEDSDGKPLDVYYLPERAYIEVAEGTTVTAGKIVAKTPREASGREGISPVVYRG